MSQFIKSCNDGLWCDLDQSKLYPYQRPVLAHYTSVATLEKIMVHEELWLSHPLLMNDDQEMKWGLIEGHRHFISHEGLKRACGSPERILTLIQAFEEAHNDFASTHAYDVYVACFCTHDPDDDDGLLSMWRAYGANGGGAAIVFDTGRLIGSDSSPLILAPVVYQSTDDRRKWLTDRLDELAAAIQVSSPSNDDIAALSRAFMERLKIFALFTKHTGFKEEREWRLVYMSDRDRNKLYEPMLSYVVTDRGLQPKFKLPLKANPPEAYLNFSLATILQSILLGPTAGTPLSVMAIKRMLARAGKSEFVDRVRASSTPFRA